MTRPVPVCTTERKPLTRLQRSELHKREQGLCCRCGLWVDPAKTWIDEHKTALALGGSNDMSNRGVAHVECAAFKTLTEDMPRIVKAKAQGAAVTSRDPGSRSKLQGPQFKQSTKRKEHPIKMPRPRSLYEDTRC